MICANCAEVFTKIEPVSQYPEGLLGYKAICPSCGYTTYMITADVDKDRLEPTFFVHCLGHGEPKHAHKHIGSAVKEAERICVLNKEPVRVYQQVAIVNPVVKTEVTYG